MRVFHLYPSRSKGAHVEGELRGRRIPARGKSLFDEKYEALSYAWGPTYNDQSHLSEYIICNGRPFGVTATLMQALRELRAANPREMYDNRFPSDNRLSWENHGRGFGLLLWIDAICIDQTNHHERAQQVAQMHWIFRGAQAVTVWLGKRPPGKEGRNVAQLFLGKGASVSRPMVETLLELSWFHRRWVVQEVHSRGHRYAMRMGELECSYGTLYDHVRAHGLHDQAGTLLLQPQPMTLLQTLFTHRDSDCSDPLDRIYALRNIASDGVRVCVNYEQSVRAGYLNAALTVIAEPSASDDVDSVSTEGSATEDDYYGPTPAELRCKLFTTTRPLELVRLLALATCFKNRTTGQLRGFPEMWIPDWRTKVRFESAEHQEAVQACVLKAQDLFKGPNMDCLTDARPTVRYVPEHTYLHVPCGRLYSIFIDRHTRRPQIQTHAGQLVELKLGLPTCGLAERIWLPLEPRGPNIAQHNLIGFVLRRGSTNATMRGRSVYQLHQCFLLSAMDGSTANPSNALAQVIESHGDNEVDKGFYLE